MNKHAIQKTAVVFWCEEDECFVVQSPLMDAIMGAGDTMSEALREFTDILSDAYEAYLEGRMGNEKPGRPQKNRIAMNTDVKLSTRESVKEMAKDFECSQGEVIDFLLCFYEHNANSNQRIYSEERIKNPIVAESASEYSYSGTAANRSLEEKVADLSHRLSAIESQLGRTDSAKSVQKSKRVRK